MGLFTTLSEPLERLVSALPFWQVLLLGWTAFITLAIAANVVQQLFFYDRNAPPVAFHIVPVLGSAVSYGMDPFKFFFANHEKYGDVFSFMLLGRKMTVCLGTKGNEFILNGKLKDVNAEEVYTPLTTPVFGSDVIYDCPNAKLMEQKKFVKFGLSTEAFRSYVSLISGEVDNFVAYNKNFSGKSGTVDITKAMSELTIYTASRSLQGKEVREKFDSSFADLYHDLDMGFSPINFMLSWAPLPHNRARDHAQRTMTRLYMDIINERRAAGGKVQGEEDMLWNLMGCSYKDGTKVPDKEVAHMMIALLMAGQHSSSSTSAWILLRLATRPDIQDELLAEQKRELGEDLPPLTYESLQKLTLNAKVVKETLRLHAPIHSIMRKVTNPLSIIAETPNSNTKEYLIPTTHTLMSAPGFTSRQENYFPQSMNWEPHRWDEGHPLAYTQLGQEKEELEDYGYGMISKGASSPYLPFGAGRHRCIGEQFAYVQLGTVLAMLMRYVRLENLDGKTGVVDTDYSSLFSRPMAPAKVKFVKREEFVVNGHGHVKA